MEGEAEGLTYLVAEHRPGIKLLDFVVLSSAFGLGSRGPQQATKRSSLIGQLFSTGVPSNAALIACLSAFKIIKEDVKSSMSKNPYSHINHVPGHLL